MSLLYSIISLFFCVYACSLQSMDGPREKRFYTYDEYGCHCDVESPLLKPARPTPKTKQPCSLYEYFGLSPNFSQVAAINVKQLIVQHVLNKKPIWFRETVVHHPKVSQIAYNTEGDALVTATANELCISDKEGRIVTTKKYPSNISTVVCHPTEKCFVVALENQTFHKIDGRGQTLKTVDARCVPLLCAVNAQTAELAALVSDQELKIWPLTGGNPLEYEVDLEKPRSLILNKEGNTFALTDQTGIQVINRDSGVTTFLVMPDSAQGIAFNPDTNALLAVTRGGDLMSWALSRKGLFVRKDCKPSKVTKLATTFLIDRAQFNPKCDLIALGSLRKPVELWNLEGERVGVLSGYSPVRFIFHPVLHQLAVVKEDCAEIWKEECFPSFEQLLLKTVLQQYLIKCICARKKPGYLTSLIPEKFIEWMSDWFHLDKELLTRTWRTIPQPKQMALIKTYSSHAKKIGDMEESILQWQKIVRNK